MWATYTFNKATATKFVTALLFDKHDISSDEADEDPGTYQFHDIREGICFEIESVLLSLGVAHCLDGGDGESDGSVYTDALGKKSARVSLESPYPQVCMQDVVSAFNAKNEAHFIEMQKQLAAHQRFIDALEVEVTIEQALLNALTHKPNTASKAEEQAKTLNWLVENIDFDEAFLADDRYAQQLASAISRDDTGFFSSLKALQQPMTQCFNGLLTALLSPAANVHGDTLHKLQQQTLPVSSLKGPGF